jgi:hypothetical protein
MSLHAFKIAVGSAALLSLGAGAAPAAVSPAGKTTWRPGPADIAGATTAVTGVHASGTTTEFAFVTNYFTHAMYIRTNGKAWIRTSGPALAKGETVVAATAITAHHLVAFAVLANETSRVLNFSNGKWTVIGKLGAPIGTATVRSGSNIWVFGSTDFAGAKALGVWHYNGRSWKRIATSGTNGSGPTATSAWAVNGTVAERYAGGKWTGTNLASLIPKATIGLKSLIGIYTTPGAPVYAVGSGNNEDSGGPIVVLRYNGHRWTRVASYSHGNMWPSAVSPDGKGGLIIGGSAGAAAQAELLHYAKGSGKLVAESVPGMTSVMNSTFETAANVHGTTVLIVGGETPAKTGILETATIDTTN